jgi:hypothetical protein
MINYRKIKEIISRYPNIADFGAYGNGISDDAILQAEKRLNFPLPTSYKWWLKNYSKSTVHGYYIYRVHDDEKIDETADIVDVYESLNDDFELEKGQILPLCVTDDEFFCFLVGQGIPDNEYYVYEAYTQSIYANNFADFLERFIKE